MKTFLVVAVLAALLAGCGDGDKQAETTPTATATASAAPVREDPDLAGYSQGVKDYYGEIHNEPTGDEHADIEAEYHQPPRPAEAGLGEAITLTGTNIGVRLRVTATKVEKAGANFAVRLKLENTGIAVYDAPLRQATLTFAGGEPVPVAAGVRAACSNGLDAEAVRLDVGRKKSGCLLFPATGETPTRFQLALELVPATAGGIWNLGA